MPTTVVYADVSDGFLTGEDATSIYSAAAASAVLADTVSTLQVGQNFDLSTTYDVYQAFLGFDTSAVTGTITSATLALKDSAPPSTNFTIEARLNDWGTSLTTADWVIPANIGGKTLLASYTTVTGWSGAVYHDFTDAAMAANVNQTGFTRLLLNSDRHRTAVTPTGNEVAAILAADQAGTTSDPKLTIVTSVTTQDVFPTSDISAGNWLNEAASATNLFASVDETPAVDSDWIQSGSEPNGDACELKLASAGVPGAGISTIKVRAMRVGGGNRLPMMIEPFAELQVDVVETTSIRATRYLRFGHGEETQSSDLTGAEVATITAWGDLRFRFTATTSTGRLRVTATNLTTPANTATSVYSGYHRRLMMAVAA